MGLIRPKLSLRGGMCRALLWSVAALSATGLQAGCGGGDESATIYDVTVSVESQTDLNSLHILLGSYFHDGDWVGHGEDLDCTLLVSADLESKHIGSDPGRGGELDLRLSNDNSFRAPNPVIRCAFRTSEEFRGITLCNLGITDVGYFCVDFLDATNNAGGATIATVAITDVSIRE
jgi:hypothetical protein